VGKKRKKGTVKLLGALRENPLLEWEEGDGNAF